MYSLIEPILLTKIHVYELSKKPLSSLMPCLKIISIKYNLNLALSKDFKVAVKILEDCVIKN